MKNRIEKLIKITRKYSIEKDIIRLNNLVSTTTYEQKIENKLAVANTVIDILQRELKEMLQEMEDNEIEKKRKDDCK